MRQIIDNFLPDDEFKTFQSEIVSNWFSWHLDTVLNYDIPKLVDIADNWQLVHSFYQPGHYSPSFRLIEPIIAKLQPHLRILLRAKVNLNPHTETIKIHGYHCDIPWPDVTLMAKTAVFYINNNNGYTIFEKDGKKIDSVANRMVIFSADDRHSGTTCTDQQFRVVLNLNFI